MSDRKAVEAELPENNSNGDRYFAYNLTTSEVIDFSVVGEKAATQLAKHYVETVGHDDVVLCRYEEVKRFVAK